MRRLIIGVAVVAGGILAARRFAPGLGRSAIAHCEAMFERMPEDFPPKRMMNGIEEIRRQNERILQRLEAEDEKPSVAAAN